MSRRFYAWDSIVPFEEDETHEFKGHRNLHDNDIPEWCVIPGTSRGSRKAISRIFNAFLNAGVGGTVYLGILDDGICKGLYLTEYQKDHFILSLKDLCKTYEPQVPDSAYTFHFVPVIKTGPSFTDNDNHTEKIDDCLEKHLRPHQIRTADPCWCDKEASLQMGMGLMPQLYIIEIEVFPSKVGFSVQSPDDFHLRLNPVYKSDNGSYYFRRLASCVKYTLEDIYELTKAQASRHYKPLVESLKNELQELLVEEKKSAEQS